MSGDQYQIADQYACCFLICRSFTGLISLVEGNNHLPSPSFATRVAEISDCIAVVKTIFFIFH